MKLLDAQVCDTWLTRFRGLMFSKRKNLLFEFDKEEIHPFHMLFVFYKIDIIFLDKDKVVVEIKRDFKPFTFYTPKNISKYVIEIPQRTDVKVGDMIGILTPPMASKVG